LGLVGKKCGKPNAIKHPINQPFDHFFEQNVTSSQTGVALSKSNHHYTPSSLCLQGVRRIVGSQDSGRWETKTQALVVTGHTRQLPNLCLERLASLSTERGVPSGDGKSMAIPPDGSCSDYTYSWLHS